MDLESSVAKHGEWKMKLRGAINRQETLDATSIGSDHRCELGQWLHGDARKQYGSLKSYATCVARHAEFHAEAGKVAKAINAKRFGEAETMIGAGSAYAQASSAASVAILALKKEARM
ncbi:MAG: CZB domain-containing protein [Hydrogenophaga sp.]|uniref:CZB domain-containing protein n=1 Tax=Hydrogenophaga sp. TaxID=1904254 RepID=UPI001DCDCC15|nr:CZB domain-containing protein [Hydrogenophaga sp.]MBX3609677.1 CZB domain-containing protein [Hydrogenophaga sp.]